MATRKKKNEIVEYAKAAAKGGAFVAGGAAASQLGGALARQLAGEQLASIETSHEVMPAVINAAAGGAVLALGAMAYKAATGKKASKAHLGLAATGVVVGAMAPIVAPYISDAVDKIVAAVPGGQSSAVLARARARRRRQMAAGAEVIDMDARVPAGDADRMSSRTTRAGASYGTF